MYTKIIEVTLKPVAEGIRKSRSRARQAEDKARRLARSGAEEVWEDLIWDVGMDPVKALLKAMETLTGYGEYDRAVDMLDALYALNGVDTPGELEDIRNSSFLTELFVDEFLAVTRKYLKDYAARENYGDDEDEDDDEDGLLEIDDLSD